MKIFLGLFALWSASVMVLASESAEDLAVRKCGNCHLMGTITKEKVDNMKAPPYWAIARKLREAELSRDDKIKFMVEFAFNPKREKMMFPIETFNRFGLMPSMSGKVTKEEIEQISTYILGETRE